MNSRSIIAIGIAVIAIVLLLLFYVMPAFGGGGGFGFGPHLNVRVDTTVTCSTGFCAWDGNTDFMYNYQAGGFDVLQSLFSKTFTYYCGWFSGSPPNIDITLTVDNPDVTQQSYEQSWSSCSPATKSSYFNIPLKAKGNYQITLKICGDVWSGILSNVQCYTKVQNYNYA